MKKSVLVAALFLSAAFTINAYAGFSIEGAYHAVRPDTAYNINYPLQRQILLTRYTDLYYKLCPVLQHDTRLLLKSPHRR